MTVDDLREVLEGCDGSDQLYLMLPGRRLTPLLAAFDKEISHPAHTDLGRRNNAALPPGIVLLHGDQLHHDICADCGKPDPAMQYRILQDGDLVYVCNSCHEKRSEEKRCPDAPLF